jgi:aspartokinase/homoserine dehydrogenase 1
MKVLKFGGSSVANAANIRKMTDIVQEAEKPLVVVVSAFKGITDLLLKLGEMSARQDDEYSKLLSSVEIIHLDAVRELLPVSRQSSCLSMVKQLINELEEMAGSIFTLRECSVRSRDRMISYGELLSSKIISAYWQTKNIEHEWIDSRKLIRTNSNFGNAAVQFSISNDLIHHHIKKSKRALYISPGFTAGDAQGNTTTLGRGGSDYTAAIYAAALNAEELQIWTDVSGMLTADPRYVPQARPIPLISYQEAMELSHFGARVIYPPTIQPVMNKEIPTLVKNTFSPKEPGTLITSHTANRREGEFICGLSAIAGITLISLEGVGMVGIPGFSKRLFESLASKDVNVILITQASSEHSICVGINEADTSIAQEAINGAFKFELHHGKVEPLQIEKGLAIVALVGDKMKNHAGISGKMFSALGRNGVNIRAIAQGSSERNISAVINERDIRKTIATLHEAFFESEHRQLNVFVIGTGNVGSKLLTQIKEQQYYLLDHLNLQLRVMGIANSRKMYFAQEGHEVNLEDWGELMEDAPVMDHKEYIRHILSGNLRNTVIVDITADEGVAGLYSRFLEKSISVVACNKIASSTAFNKFSELKSLAREYHALYLFETNVGAGLPIISTLNDLTRSGDAIVKIEAVLSGTLNYVFNKYDATASFASIVRQAQVEGYTEPDPRLDLGGIDVLRKILILARESGAALEMSDLTIESFMPESCMKGTVDEFYRELERQEPHFIRIYNQAATAGSKLKFVATYEWNNGNPIAFAGLRQIKPESDFYHLYGKDNIVMFYTKRYHEQPLVVKGAGAGAEVTASGIFADIIKCMPLD